MKKYVSEAAEERRREEAARIERHGCPQDELEPAVFELSSWMAEALLVGFALDGFSLNELNHEKYEAGTFLFKTSVIKALVKRKLCYVRASSGTGWHNHVVHEVGLTPLGARVAEAYDMRYVDDGYWYGCGVVFDGQTVELIAHDKDNPKAFNKALKEAAARIAHSVEQSPDKRQVVGAKPTASTILPA